MNAKDARRLQGQVFALQAFLDSISRTLAVTDPDLFEAIVCAARPVLDDVRKSSDSKDPMVAGFVETFERLLGKSGAPPFPPGTLSVIKGGKE